MVGDKDHHRTTMKSDKPNLDGFDSADSNGGEDDAEWFDFDAEGDWVIGEVTNIAEDCGQYDSRVYTLATDDGPVCFWGKAAIDSSVDKLGVEEGWSLYVERAGTYENQYGEQINYDVKGKDPSA